MLRGSGRRSSVKFQRLEHRDDMSEVSSDESYDSEEQVWPGVVLRRTLERSDDGAFPGIPLRSPFQDPSPATRLRKNSFNKGGSPAAHSGGSNSSSSSSSSSSKQAFPGIRMVHVPDDPKYSHQVFQKEKRRSMLLEADVDELPIRVSSGEEDSCDDEGEEDSSASGSEEEGGDSEFYSEEEEFSIEDIHLHEANEGLRIIPEANARWYWFLGDSWRKYHVQRSATIEKHYQGESFSGLTFSKYTLDIKERLHTEVPSRKVFEMVRGSWFWINDSGKPIPYFEDVAVKLESLYHLGDWGGRVEISERKYVLLRSETDMRQFDVYDPSGDASRKVIRGYPEENEGGAVASAPPHPARRRATVNHTTPKVVRKKQQQQQQGEDDAPPAVIDSCCICLTAPKNALIKPCYHICLCISCAQRLVRLQQQCPICRGQIKSVKRVFIA